MIAEFMPAQRPKKLALGKTSGSQREVLQSKPLSRNAP